MKIDTSSYYPKSPLDDDDEIREIESVESSDFELNNSQHSSSLFPEKEIKEETVEETETLAEDPTPAPGHYDPTETERFCDNISTALSWILVPLLMPVFGTLLAFNLSILDFMSFNTKLTFTLIVAAINLGLPALLVLLLKRFGLVQDVGLNGRKERLIPYIITILCMGATAYFMYLKHAPLWFAMFFAGGGVAGLINLLINFKWKISAHSAGIAGVVAMLIRIMHDGVAQPSTIVWIFIWVALAGLLGSARVWLGRHTAAQVIAGYCVGFLSVFFMTMI